MKYHKLILISALVMATVIPTQAAVYGTLKQDMYFNVNKEEQVIKASGSGVSIIGEDEENYLIRIDENVSDTVSKGLVELPGIITKTKASGASVRMEADAESAELEVLAKGEMVMALEKHGDFYKVKINDTVGYITASEIENGKLTNLEDTADLGKQVIEHAKTYLGGRYVYGGTDLNTGVDCSGFTQQIMKHFNISLERSSRGQYASNGVKVSLSELKPGDLVFYGYGGSINHVAIYAGDNKIIHASTERTGITMANLNIGSSIIGAKRVIKS